MISARAGSGSMLNTGISSLSASSASSESDFGSAPPNSSSDTSSAAATGPLSWTRPVTSRASARCASRFSG